MGKIDWVSLRAQVEEETIMEKSALIQDNPDGYECSACCIGGQPCDVGLAVKVERQRIVKLLEEEMERIRLMDGYPATNALANIRATLIKGEK